MQSLVKVMVTTLISTDTRYPVNRKIIRKAVSDTLFANKMEDNSVEVSVVVVGKRKMKILCNLYMSDGRMQDVLSFPLEEITDNGGMGFVGVPDDVLRLGDVVLCWPELVAKAALDDIMVDEELYTLTTHAVEHLLGKHHE